MSKFHDAEKLHKEYKSYFGGKYSASRSASSSPTKKVKDVCNAILKSKKRVLVLLVICFFISMIILNKIKPKFVLEKGSSRSDKRIDIYSMCLYSLVCGVVLTLIFSLISFHVPVLKEILFKESCGSSMCSL